MSLLLWLFLLPAVTTVACLNAPGRTTLQDADDASGGDPGDTLAETGTDGTTAVQDEAPFDDAPTVEADTPRADEALPDLPVADEVAPDPEPDTAPEALSEPGGSDPGTDTGTVTPTLVRCVGRPASGGVVGGIGVWLRGSVGAGVRALPIGK